MPLRHLKVQQMIFLSLHSLHKGDCEHTIVFFWIFIETTCVKHYLFYLRFKFSLLICDLCCFDWNSANYISQTPLPFDFLLVSADREYRKGLKGRKIHLHFPVSIVSAGGVCGNCTLFTGNQVVALDSWLQTFLEILQISSTILLLPTRTPLPQSTPRYQQQLHSTLSIEIWANFIMKYNRFFLLNLFCWNAKCVFYFLYWTPTEYTTNK